jgi:hypothetical protein
MTETDPHQVNATETDPHRVDVSEAAASLLQDLTARHGPLMFHQSGGCCDGSSPMCFPDGEFITSEADIHLGDLVVPGLDRGCRSGCRRPSTSTGSTPT